MAKDVYLICPVRDAEQETLEKMNHYVDDLESKGISVHYPPRDVDQTEDGVGLAISTAHREAMLKCKEIHVFWDNQSYGSHFDLGMAFMLNETKGIPIVLADPVISTPKRSYGNILNEVAEKSLLY